MSAFVPFPLKHTRQTAPVSVSSSGDNSVIAGTAGFSIKILSGLFLPASSVSMTIKSGTASGGSNVALTGAMPFGGSGNPSGLPLSHNPDGHFFITAGDDFNLYLSGAVAVTGWVVFTLT